MLSYFFFKVTLGFSEDFGLSADEEQYGNWNITDPLSPQTLLFTILRYTLLPWNANMELASDRFPAVIDINTKIPTYDWMCSDKQKCLNIKVQMWLCEYKREWLQPTPSWKSQVQHDKTWWSTQFHWLGLQRECNGSEDSIWNFSLWDSFRQERNLPLLHGKNVKWGNVFTPEFACGHSFILVQILHCHLSNYLLLLCWRWLHHWCVKKWACIIAQFLRKHVNSQAAVLHCIYFDLTLAISRMLCPAPLTIFSLGQAFPLFCLQW